VPRALIFVRAYDRGAGHRELTQDKKEGELRNLPLTRQLLADELKSCSRCSASLSARPKGPARPDLLHQPLPVPRRAEISRRIGACP